MSKRGFVYSATKRSHLYLAMVVDKNRLKFLKCRLKRVWTQKLRKQVQKTLPIWQAYEILLAWGA